MPFVQLGVGHRCCVYNRFVVAEHHGGVGDVDTQVPKNKSEINDLFGTCSSSNILRSEGSGFNSRLQFRMEINDRLIRQVDDTSNRSSTDEIMI